MKKWLATAGRWCSLFGLVFLGFASCNRPDAPSCLMRAGDGVEVVEVFDESFRVLRVYNHLNVVVEMWDSAATELVWSGPENVLAHRWSHREGDALELGMWIVVSGCVT